MTAAKGVLTVTDSKRLEKLLDADFNLLDQDLRQMAARAKNAAEDRITDERKKEIATARRVYIDGYGTRDVEGFTVKSKALNKSIADEHDRIDVEMNEALRISAGKRVEAKRNLIRSSLSTEALAVLDTLPKANDLMREAMNQRAGLTAVKL